MNPAPEVLEDRALSFVLAATVSGYPNESFHQRLSQVVEVRPADWTAELIAESATSQGLERLRADFLSSFEVGKGRLPLHETEYGRTGGLSKGNDLADLAGFYRAYAFELNDAEGSRELYDHLAVELEFYSSLLAREAVLVSQGDEEGISIVRATRCSFLNDHLGRLAIALQSHGQLPVDSVWAKALAYSVELVREECASLGVTPPALEFVGLNPEPDEVSCAVNFNPPGGKGLS